VTPAVLSAPAGTWPAPVAPGALMQAVVFREFGPPEVLHAEAVPAPVPAAGEVLVQVAAVSIGRFLDLAARSGNHPYRGYTFPHILGAEHAGVVAATGPSVTGWRPGDRVACFPVITDGSCGFCLAGDHELCPSLQLIGTHRPGAYAQYVAVPAASLHRIPDGVSPVQATGLALAGPVAMNQLRRAGFRPGQWVLVQGASSGLGSVTASLARHLGGHVIAASRGAAKRDRLTVLAADAILDPADPGFVGSVRELTGGGGADIVIDNLGEPGLWALSLASLAPGGALVSSGSFLGRQVSVDLQRLYLLGQRIIGVRTGNPASVSALWAEVYRGFRPVLDTAFPLTDAARAHRYLADGQTVGRVVLLVAHPDPEGRDQPCA
jgi:NADPH:quinone reductase-like Zn-dependent oxidoreductase